MKSHRTSLTKLVLCFVLSITALLANQKVLYAKELTAKNYQENQAGMGVVLVDVNWGRQWGCGKFDNAQLINLKFEQFPASGVKVDPFSVLELKTPSRLFVDPVFLSYGFIVKPGEYAFTGFSVKVANSRPIRVGHFNADRTVLIKDGAPQGGTFTVGAGEVVYIGNFFVDCLQEPIPWRYYSEGRDNFLTHVGQFKQKYKFLKDKDVIYRLFKTKSFGLDYELPASTSQSPASKK